MSVNKVVYNNETLIDLTPDTVTAADVTKGITFHLSNGESAVGTNEGGKQLDYFTNEVIKLVCTGDKSMLSSSGWMYYYNSYEFANFIERDTASQIYSTRYYSTATSSDVGKNIANYLAPAPLYVYGSGPLLTSKTSWQVVWRYNSATYTQSYSGTPRATLFDSDGKILMVDTCYNITVALNNKTVDISNGVGIVGDYASGSVKGDAPFTICTIVLN